MCRRVGTSDVRGKRRREVGLVQFRRLQYRSRGCPFLQRSECRSPNPAVLFKDPIHVVHHERGLPQRFVDTSPLPVVMRRNTKIPAALVMYQRARKLTTLAAEPENFVAMAELRIEAYLGSVNALSLVDQKVAWIAIPLNAESDYTVRCLLLFLGSPN